MSKKILIVDDAPYMRLIIKEFLLKFGYVIAGEATNGKEAVEKYFSVCPDAVLMDISMPGMDGLEALKEIIKADKEAKIIIMPHLGQHEYVVECMKYGAKDIVVKPLREENLKEALDKLFQ